MTKKVEQFINRKEFMEEAYSNLACYTSSINLKEDFFSKEEKIELFNYFFDLRKKGELNYFRLFINFNIRSPVSSNCYKEIESEIIEKLKDEINSILEKRSYNSKDIFNLFDYIFCISDSNEKEFKYNIIEYINKTLSYLNDILCNHKEYNENIIINALDYLSSIKNLYLEDIEDSINKIIQNNNISEKIKKTLAQKIGLIILKNEKYFLEDKNIIYFMIKSLDYYYDELNFDYDINIIIIKDIITKIKNEDILLSIFNDFFPKINYSSANVTYFYIQFIILEKEKNIIDKIEIEKKEILFQFVMSNLNINELKIKIPHSLNEQEIDLNFLEPEIKQYVLDISKENIEFYKFDLIFRNAFIKYIDSQEIYDRCSKEAKKYRIYLVTSKDDHIYNIKESDEELLEIIKNHHNYLICRDKYNDYKKDCEEEKVNCIKNFFSKNEIERDIDVLKSEFKNKEYISKKEFYLLYRRYSDYYENIDEYLKKDFIILNPFLISYIRDLFYFSKKESLHLNNILSCLIKNWDKFYILHLYNYLITIDKYDYNFSSDEKDIIIKYFENINFEFPYYILLHLKNVFGFEININNFFSNKDIILKLINYDRKLLKVKNKIYILFNNVLEIPYEGIYCNNLDDNIIDESIINLIKGHMVLEQILDMVKINNLYHNNEEYNVFLFAINMYDQSENKNKYDHKVKYLLKNYFRFTLEHSGNIGTISKLIVKTIEDLNIISDILNLILEEDTIEVCHYNIISEWQKNIVFNKKDFVEKYSDNDKEKILDNIYNIRKKIKNNKETKIVEYNNLQKDNNINDIQKVKDLQDAICSMNIYDKQEVVNNFSKLKEKIEDIINENQSYDLDYYRDENIVELLFFLDIDKTIFNDFYDLKTTKYDLQEKAIYYFNYIFNNVEKYKDSFEYITKVIHDNFNKLKPKINYPVNEVYTPQFELVVVIRHIIENILNSYFYFSEEVYDNLLSIAKIEEEENKNEIIY